MPVGKHVSSQPVDALHSSPRRELPVLLCNTWSPRAEWGRRRSSALASQGGSACPAARPRAAASFRLAESRRGGDGLARSQARYQQQKSRAMHGREGQARALAPEQQIRSHSGTAESSPQPAQQPPPCEEGGERPPFLSQGWGSPCSIGRERGGLRGAMRVTQLPACSLGQCPLPPAWPLPGVSTRRVLASPSLPAPP